VKIQRDFSTQQFALLLAAAICERFPNAQIASVAAHPSRFAMDVFIDSPWDQGYMPLIEKQCVAFCAQ